MAFLKFLIQLILGWFKKSPPPPKSDTIKASTVKLRPEDYPQFTEAELAELDPVAMEEQRKRLKTIDFTTPLTDEEKARLEYLKDNPISPFTRFGKIEFNSEPNQRIPVEQDNSTNVPENPNDRFRAPLLMIMNDEVLVNEFMADVVDKGINNPLHLAHICARIKAETKFEDFSEDLDYSAGRLMQVWPKVFTTKVKAAEYAHNPEKLANFIYGGKYGNTEPNDGWTYRGRGGWGVTFKGNYRDMQKDTGIPVLDNPEILATEHKFSSVYWFLDTLQAG
jgi:predicted chitinase